MAQNNKNKAYMTVIYEKKENSRLKKSKSCYEDLKSRGVLVFAEPIK